MKPTRIGSYRHKVNVCTVAKCPRRTLAKRLCGPHYHDVITRRRSPRPPADSGVCSADGCSGAVYDDTLCVGHFCENYTRTRVAQTVRGILARVAAEDVGACWVWPGAKNRQGYGVVSMGGETFLAHRLVYELLTGESARGVDIDHMCRVPACCNPAHLSAVDALENMRRRIAVQSLCTHCHPAPIPVGETLHDRLARWGLDENFTPVRAA